MTTFLPEQLFAKAMSYINWRDTLESQFDEQENYRPYGLEGSLEDMLDLFLSHPYVKGESYFVASKPQEKGNTSQGFVKFYNRNKPCFVAMCYFPEMEEVHTVLPKAAFDRLPAELWKERKALPVSRYDKHEDVCIKDGEQVVYVDFNGVLRSARFELRPTFGNCISPKVNKIVSTKELSQWLRTKEGKAFQQKECLDLLKEKAPMFYKAYTEKLTGKQIIKSLIG